MLVVLDTDRDEVSWMRGHLSFHNSESASLSLTCKLGSKHKTEGAYLHAII